MAITKTGQECLEKEAFAGVIGKGLKAFGNKALGKMKNFQGTTPPGSKRLYNAPAVKGTAKPPKPQNLTRNSKGTYSKSSIPGAGFKPGKKELGLVGGGLGVGAGAGYLAGKKSNNNKFNTTNRFE